MDNIIEFTQFHIDDGLVSCEYKDAEDGGDLIFELTPKIKPSNELIAIALSTLCGRGMYGKIKINLEISAKTMKDIADFCHAELVAIESNKENNNRIKNNIITLSFSGGFDSLAAKYLMPADVKLVSMDFGGKFARERVFFSDFDTCIVKTNLLDTHLRKNSWSFMGIASILFSDYLGTNYHTFGGILEAGASNFSKNSPAAKNITFPPFVAADMINAPYVLGVTEVGTALILAHYAPELINASLTSLANQGEEKKYRKQILSSIVEKKKNLQLNLDSFDEPRRAVLAFGQNFAVDFLSFYFIKYAGLEIASKMLREIPEEVVVVSQKLSLAFFERVNTNFIENFPSELIGGLLDRLSEAGILPYTQFDWEELQEILLVLKKYHDI